MQNVRGRKDWMKVSEESDRRHLEAAEGWLELGNWEEGTAELQQLSQDASSHPETLRVLIGFLAAAGQWALAGLSVLAMCLKFPDHSYGWYLLGMTLNRAGRSAQARDGVLAVIEQVRDRLPLYFCLACCEYRLGNLKEARRWLKKSMVLRGTAMKEIVLAAEPGLMDLCKARCRGKRSEER
jgi:predicted Zn-dependent protease